MLSIYTGKTKTNPRDNSDNFIDVELSTTKQVVKAVFGYSTDKSRKKTNPNIELDTDVLLLKDGRGTFFVVNSLSVGTGNLADKKSYENNDIIEFEADTTFSVISQKISIGNGTEEVVSLLMEIIDEVIAMQHVGNLGVPTVIFPASQTKLTALKTRIESLKVV